MEMIELSQIWYESATPSSGDSGDITGFKTVLSVYIGAIFMVWSYVGHFVTLRSVDFFLFTISCDAHFIACSYVNGLSGLSVIFCCLVMFLPQVISCYLCCCAYLQMIHCRFFTILFFCLIAMATEICLDVTSLCICLCRHPCEQTEVFIGRRGGVPYR